MPDAVIMAVEARAEEEKQPLIVGGCLLFEWRPNDPMQMDAAGEIVTIDDDTDDDDEDGGDEAKQGHLHDVGEEDLDGNDAIYDNVVHVADNNNEAP